MPPQKPEPLSGLAEDMLRRAYVRITPADQFTQGAYARDAAGRSMSLHDLGHEDREAASWCALGAVWAEAKASGWVDPLAAQAAALEIEEALDAASRRLNPSHGVLECAIDASDLPIAHAHALACMAGALAAGKVLCSCPAETPAEVACFKRLPDGRVLCGVCGKERSGGA